jgi:predicted amidohydrolase
MNTIKAGLVQMACTPDKAANIQKSINEIKNVLQQEQNW